MLVIVLVGAVVTCLIAAQFAKPSAAAAFGAFVGLVLAGISNGHLPIFLSVAGGAALAAMVNMTAKDG